jgi:hypothetical protein
MHKRLSNASNSITHFYIHAFGVTLDIPVLDWLIIMRPLHHVMK